MSYQQAPGSPPPYQPPTPPRRTGGWSPGRFSPAIALVGLVVVAILVGSFFVARRGGGAEPTPTSGVAGRPISAPSGAPVASAVSAASVAPVSSVPLASVSVAPASAGAKVFAVGNTDGDGVFLRRTPSLADRDTAYPDGTLLTAIGADVTAEGEIWHHVRAPDGKTGYVPAKYTVDPPQ